MRHADAVTSAAPRSLRPVLAPGGLGLRRILAIAAGGALVAVLVGRFGFTAALSVLVPLGAVAALFLLLRRMRRRRGGDGRARLEFTREGKYLVAITLGVGFAAINTGNNLLYLFLGMLLSMIIVSGVLSEQTLRGLSVARTLPRQVFAGRPFLTGIALTNDKKRLPSFSVQVEDVIDGRPLAKKCYFLKVPAGARQHTSYRAEFERRGLYRYEGLKVGTRFPFAFFVKSHRLAAPVDLVVLPRVHPIAHPALETQDQQGTLAHPRRGTGREFHGLREYRTGDDARDIHWKRSAREGRLVLREYESEGVRRVSVVLNDRLPPEVDAAEAAADLDRCVDLAASLVVHFADRGYVVDLVTGDDQLTVQEGGRGLHPALRRLAVLEFQPAPPDATPLRPPPRGGPALLVTHRRGRHLAAASGFAQVYEQGA